MQRLTSGNVSYHVLVDLARASASEGSAEPNARREGTGKEGVSTRRAPAAVGKGEEPVSRFPDAYLSACATESAGW